MEQRCSQSIVQDKSFHFAVQSVGYIRRQEKDHVNLTLSMSGKLASGTDSDPKCDNPKSGTQHPELRTQHSELPGR